MPKPYYLTGKGKVEQYIRTTTAPFTIRSLQDELRLSGVEVTRGVIRNTLIELEANGWAERLDKTEWRVTSKFQAPRQYTRQSRSQFTQE